MTTEINFQGTAITSQDPCDLGLGYFEILSSEELCVYPPLCLAPGLQRIEAQNAQGEGTGRQTVELEAPSEPTMATTPELMVGKTQRFYVHNGTGPNSCPGPAIVYLILSSSPQPTIIPGFVNAQLGAMATSYICGPWPHEPRVHRDRWLHHPARVRRNADLHAVALLLPAEPDVPGADHEPPADGLPPVVEHGPPSASLPRLA